jgi:hypothetical protein
VYLLHWTASAQADLDHGRTGIGDLYPNAYNDVRPEELMDARAAEVFYPGRYSGNRAAQVDLKTPVEELTARGFGSATTHETQTADGRGVFVDGRWRVNIAFDMQGGKLKADLKPGRPSQLGLAVWSGSHGQRGARKQFAGWIAFDVEAA